MAEILIHRCSLRLVRRGGWNWGPAPRRLIEKTVESLPELLARKLEGLLPTEVEDRQIASPLRIHLSMPLSELMREDHRQFQAQQALEHNSKTSLERQMESAIQSALGWSPQSDIGSSEHVRPTGEGLAHGTRGKSSHKSSALARILLTWHEQGVLDDRLYTLADDVIEGWHRTLWRAASGPRANPDSNEQALAEEIEVITKKQTELFLQTETAVRVRLRMRAATEISSQKHVPLSHPLIWKVLDRLLPVEGVHKSRTHSAKPTAIGPDDFKHRHAVPKTPGLISSALPSHISESPRTHAASWETRVSCALPFLLLGPLARLGFIDTLSAVLESVELTEDASLFAVALAYKVLDIPERGWCRTPESRAAAAAFAGKQNDVSEHLLVDFARKLAGHTTPTDVHLADAVIEGRKPGSAVLLRSLETHEYSGYLLVEPEGCFVIGWGQDLDSFLPPLDRMGSPVVMISPESAGPGLLAQLANAGVTFVTDVPPTRNEPWAQIQQGTSRLGWTNHCVPSTLPLLSAARALKSSCERAESLYGSFFTDRPGVVRASAPGFDHTLALAASTAAGLLSWKLWQVKGPTTPQLALERFCDLEGRIRFTEDAVHVGLPRGRRHQELSDCGLLAPVEYVPWLGGRRVEYGAA